MRVVVDHPHTIFLGGENMAKVEQVEKTETVIVFKVNRPLMDHEYEELEKRVRQENEKSGLKIVLAPYSVDVEITGG